MGINYRTGAWAPAISLLAAVFLYLPAGGGRAVAADFESIKFEVVNRAVPDGKGGSLEIKADGTCTYHGERRPPFRRAADPWPAKTYTHTLSDARMARLRALIAETKWLEIPPGERTSFSSHDGTTTITLEGEGETRKAVRVGRGPGPYIGLLRFKTTLCRQERRLYELQCGDRSARVMACRDLGGGIPGLRGEPGRGSPAFKVDYRRYVGEMRKILDEPEKNRDRGGFLLMAGIAVLSQAGDEEYYEKIAGFISDENLQVSRTAADALAHIRRPELIPYLVGEMENGASTAYAAWALIRMSDIAVPAIAKVLAANDSQLAHALVRAYICQWDRLAAPLDPRVLDALRIGLPKRNGSYAGYYGYVLDLARLRPITTDPVLGFACDGVVRRETSTLLYGWYICKDGKIVDHASPPKTDTSVKRLYPVHFKPEFVGGKLRFSAGWRTERKRPWRAPVTGVGTYEVPVPENSVFEMDYHYGRQKTVPGVDRIKSGMRLTPQYRVLWQGRVVSEGKDVFTLAYVGRLASPTDPVQEFVLPKEPLPYMPAPPKFVRWHHRK